MLETLAKFTDDNELSILLWCKSGTHRSVVMSQACGWALSQLDVEVIGRGPIITGGGLSPLIDRVRCGGGLAVKWNRHLDNKVLEPVHIKGTRLNHHFTKAGGMGRG